MSKGDKVLQDEAGVLSKQEKVGNVVVKQKVKANGQIAQLRQNGYKVRVFHNRRYTSPSGDVFYTGIQIPETSLESRGGLTVVQVITPTNEKSVGYAKCSDKDSYNKKLGAKIALNRALAELNK
jgi:hypothetical protein